jgi:hypothetical protein
VERACRKRGREHKYRSREAARVNDKNGRDTRTGLHGVISIVMEIRPLQKNYFGKCVTVTVTVIEEDAWPRYRNAYIPSLTMGF